MKHLLISILIVSLFASCKKKEEESAEPIDNSKYSTMLMVGAWPNTAYFMLNLQSLTEGTADLKGNGAEMTKYLYAQDVIQKNGYYYHAKSSTGRLGKYHVSNNKLYVDKEILFTELDWSSVVWADDETLVMFGTNADQNKIRYAILNTSTMVVKSSGDLSVNALTTGMAAYNVCFAQYRDNKIFLGYGMRSNWDNWPVMESADKAMVAVIDYATMTVDKTLEDARSTSPGGPNVYCPYSFVDENNDLYFITDPVDGYNYTQPSYIYKIKSGETELDATYDFNFSSTVSNGMAAAIWYIGEGKAIIRTCVAGTSIDADHSYSIVDVHSGAFIKTLDLPADKGERYVQSVVIEDGKAYIAVNSSDRDYVWIYDPKTDALTKGIEFVGGLDYILRLEKLR
ncbi:DUF4374 domain-containing protein [Cytophaga hutchinsonii]|jgi:hypothetical protein|uniref:DUF4374 domain-containing protein n=1 Tax=Cytophaga hutchinsonii (strain ATCC 33406 / DSM 1761 / CIP 103989 / NBRC 15051 / NCIMB 9469 / D465) TaxID=269798 RepID=A0A6N4SMP9_CYTH3|nr:DUF4374 domain-containing protein [Cytophaga hutchinsonii]ABG57550.1 hypothetical protein CHU_0258 [Cytophaga hutchinsonii ATCC 33406]SFW99734.1 hypothetical protein SAMN04487930_101112 [Cytophaga hutchinsonii ATCC 33406]